MSDAIPLIKGTHARRSPFINRAMYFAPVTPHNISKIKTELQLGRFGWLKSTWFKRGSWTQPMAFSNLDELGRAIDALGGRTTQLAIAMHCYLNSLSQDGYDFSDPIDDWGNILDSVFVGYLTKDVNEVDRQLVLDADPRKLPDWQHLAVGNESIPSEKARHHYNTYAVGKEMIRCVHDDTDPFTSLVGTTMNVHRGAERTRAAKHKAGDPVYYVPRSGGYYLKPCTELHANRVRDFKQAIRILDASLVYIDGDSTYPARGMKYDEAHDYIYARGRKPYVGDVDVPLMFGGPVPTQVRTRVFAQCTGDAFAGVTPDNVLFNKWLSQFRGATRYRENHFQKCAGWLPLDENTTVARIEAIYAAGLHAPYIWVRYPSFDRKPETERHALLRLIGIYNQERS